MLWKPVLRIHAITTHLHHVTSLFSFSSLWVTRTPAVSSSSMCWWDGDEPAQLECRSTPLLKLCRGRNGCLQTLGLLPKMVYLFFFFLASQHNLKVPDLDAGKINAQIQDTIPYKSNEALLLKWVSSALLWILHTSA